MYAIRSYYAARNFLAPLKYGHCIACLLKHKSSEKSCRTTACNKSMLSGFYPWDIQMG